jgi:hypothetical protein
MGQLAVSGTATLAAVGSTLLLNYCVTPYVHELREVGGSYEATTATMWGTRMNTKFGLDEVVGVAKANTSRPFCNFLAAGKPLYM